MNLKMLLPTYRTRFRVLQESLNYISENQTGREEKIFLNLGCGEGDFDRHIAKHFTRGFACDINASDIAFCKTQVGLLPITYTVDDAHATNYHSESMDCIVCIDVIEHTQNPEKVVMEIERMLKPGGYGVISFPRSEFPWLYDPINRILSLFAKHLSIGAYSFGHDKLIYDSEFRHWAERVRFEIISRKSISGPMIAMFEMYWAGVLQKLLKQNASNKPEYKRTINRLRPTANAPRAVCFIDWLIDTDARLFRDPSHSVGSVYILRKRDK